MEEKPEPKLIKTKDGRHVTDGWIGDMYFEVVKQPSNETIDKLYEFFVEMGKENIKKDIFVSRLIELELDYTRKLQKLMNSVKKERRLLMYKVTIKNPEALEKACKNFTEVVIKLYNEGKFNIPDKVHYKEEIVWNESNNG